MNVWLAAFLVILQCEAGHASCWFDDEVRSLAGQVAGFGFPAVARNMPEIVVCDSQHFPPGIGGDYNSGFHRIRIPVWQLDRAELRSVLAHELAHGEVAIGGGDGGPGGHGRKFYVALLRAGYHDEARRVAQYVGNADTDLAMAEAAVMGAPRGMPGRRLIRRCELVAHEQRVVLPDGRYWVVRTPVLRCYHVSTE